MALPPLSLSAVPNNTIVSNISGHAEVPAANSLTELLDAMLGSQPGTMIMRTGGAWAPFAPGGPGQVLQVETYIPNWGSLTKLLDHLLGGGQGTIMFRGLTTWMGSPPGAPGQFLETQGALDYPRWTPPIPTGATMSFIGGVAPSGWVLASGGTIGDRSSGATARANDDTLALWQLLYATWPDAQAPVSGGRGASASADFTAHKTIRLPDLRGRVVAGKDDMGGTAARRLTAEGSGLNGTTPGAVGGAETHTLTGGQMPSHSHHVTDAGHVHAMLTRTDLVNTGRAGAYAAGASAGGQTTQSATTGITIDNAGGGGAHNNTQPTIVMNYIIKL
jgi:microcystin-dependent protein